MAPGAGAGVGLVLGGLAGGLVGGVVSGLKAGAAHALAGATRMVSGAAPSPLSPDGFRAKLANVQTHARERQTRHAQREAEGALAEFARSAEGLQRHPTLTAFWRDVDQQAGTRFQGNRAAVFQEMAGRAAHPLRVMFDRQTRTDPDVALHYVQAHAAFERLQTVWAACAQAHQKTGQGWAPSPEQMQTLRAACRRVPPSPDRPPLVEQAERLLRALVQTLRQAFDRMRPPAAGSTAAPAP